jgi:hypothetical protein
MNMRARSSCTSRAEESMPVSCVAAQTRTG